MFRETDEERKERIRREWLRKQKLEKEHEELKKRKILEFEEKRSAWLKEKEKEKKRKSESTSQTSKSSSSNSPDDKDSRKETCRFDNPELKEPDNIKIDESACKSIQIVIQRPISTSPEEIRREVINAEEIIIIRRKGEGSKPLSQRKEFSEIIKKGPNVQQPIVSEGCSISVVSPTRNRNDDSKKRSSSRFSTSELDRIKPSRDHSSSRHDRFSTSELDRSKPSRDHSSSRHDRYSTSELDRPKRSRDLSSSRHDRRKEGSSHRSLSSEDNGRKRLTRDRKSVSRSRSRSISRSRQRRSRSHSPERRQYKDKRTRSDDRRSSRYDSSKYRERRSEYQNRPREHLDPYMHTLPPPYTEPHYGGQRFIMPRYPMPPAPRYGFASQMRPLLVRPMMPMYPRYPPPRYMPPNPY